MNKQFFILNFCFFLFASCISELQQEECNSSEETCLENPVDLNKIEDDNKKPIPPSGTIPVVIPGDNSTPPPPPNQGTITTQIKKVSCQNISDQLKAQSGNIIRVSPTANNRVQVEGSNSVQTLRSVVNSANSGDIIELAPGRYTFDTGATNVYTGLYFAGANNISLRGSTGNPEDVILDSEYKDLGNESSLIGIVASNIKIYDLTVQNSVFHLIHANGVAGDGLQLHNVILKNGGQQFFKTSPAGGDTAKDMKITCNQFIMDDIGRKNVWSTGPTNSCYTGGIDAHKMEDSLIADNYFEGIYCNPNETHPDHGLSSIASGGLAEHAIHLWDNVQGINIIERNEIKNCARGIGIGLGSTLDNTTAIIRGNLIFSEMAAGGEHDVGIGVEAVDLAKIYNNTIYYSHPSAYPNAIEYRFSNTNAEISNNLTNKLISSRNGGNGQLINNITNAQSNLFKDITIGDLHLTDCSLGSLSSGNFVNEFLYDFDYIQIYSTGIKIGADQCSQTNEPNQTFVQGQSITLSEGNVITPMVPEGKTCLANVSYEIECQGEITNAALAHKNQICSSDGMSFSYSNCILKTCVTNYQIDQNSCVMTQTGPPSGSTNNLSLFSIDDMQYLGAFKIPGGEFGQSSASYGQSAIAYNSDNNSLFVTSIYENSIGEFSIPALSMSENQNELNTSTNMQGFVNILNKGTVVTGNQNNKITGMYYKNNKLVVNSEIWYDNSRNPNSTQVIHQANNLNTSSVSGYFQINGDTTTSSHAAGYITDVPQEWRTAIGNDHIMGWSSVYSINSRYSIGPSMFGFDMNDVLNPNKTAGQNISVTAFMNFPYSADGSMQLSVTGNDVTSPVSNDTALWNVLSKGLIGFIVPGTKTFAVFGYSGGFESGISYKTPTDGRVCPGSCSNNASDNANYYWLFNLEEILSAQNVYDPRPYAFGKISLPFDQNGARRISGASFDPLEKVLYLSIYSATDEWTPIITAFKINP